jgi:hypothetical protein
VRIRRARDRLDGRAAGLREQYSYATFDQIRRHGDFFDGALAFTDCCGTSVVTIGGENHPSTASM